MSRLIGFGIIVATFAVAVQLSGAPLEAFVDLPAMLLLAMFLLGGLWVAYGPRVVWAAFRQSVRSSSIERARARNVLGSARQLTWSAGVVSVLLMLISMFGDMSDPAAIGATLSLGLMPLLYAAILAELVFAPLRDSLSSTAEGEPPQDPPSQGNHAMLASLLVVAFIVILFLASILSLTEMRYDP